MSEKRQPRISMRALAIASGAALISGSTLPITSATPALPAAPAQQFDDGYYVVMMEGAPSASYTGGEVGLAATKPEAGERLIANDPEVRAYEEHITEQQQETAAEAGVEITESYATAFNGFAASLTGEQASALAKTDGVAAVYRDRPIKLATVNSPDFLKLTGPRGVWRKFGAPAKAGEGVVVGILDTGINEASPSFAGSPMPSEKSNEMGKPSVDADGNVHMLKSDGNLFTGNCQKGENFEASACNDKVISAQYFPEAYLKNVPEENRADELSPRDFNGHGTHVAGTAAGNWNVPASIDGVNFGRASGMAPGAKIASYKVCFEDTDPNTGDCSGAASVTAINKAVKDGVDVLNYSISGSRGEATEPVQLAFMNASAAGVFVAAAAGNDGGPTDVAHGSPWITTVAAGTFHNYDATIVTGDDTKLLGVSVTAGGLKDQTPAIHARDAAAEGVEADDAALCLENTLDEAKAKGKVVVCDRGKIARVDKSAEAKRVGAAGSVLRNMGPNSSNADPHSVPTVHIDEEAGKKLGEYLKTDSPTLAFAEGNTTDKKSPAVPAVAGFSSRGPTLMADGNLLKPDIMAPGVNVVAAIQELDGKTDEFGMFSGTSMASPHVAGLAALLYGKNPKWDPMTIKSAMVTTASQIVTPEGKPDNDPFNGGAGQVNPSAFYDPGLVYKTELRDWLGYLAGLGHSKLVPPMRAMDVNAPSIAVSELAHSETVTRKLTAVKPGKYTATAKVPGMDVTIEPSTLEFSEAGQEREVKITMTRTDATIGQYAFGSLTWTGPGNDVKIPMALRPRKVKFPKEINVKGGKQEASFEITGGDTGKQKMSVQGLVEGQRHTGKVTAGEKDLEGDGDDHNKVYTLTVPEGTKMTKLDLIPGDGAEDLDLFLLDSEGKFVPEEEAGATAGSRESITIEDLKPGDYKVVLHAYEAEEGGADFDLRMFNLPEGDAGNMTVTPNEVELELGKTQDVKLEFKDLDANKVYLGLLHFDGLDRYSVVNVG